MPENLCIYVYMGICPLRNYPSPSIFISWVKAPHAPTNTVPPPHPAEERNVEAIQEFTFAFVKGSVSFPLKQRSGPGPSLAGERRILPSFPSIHF